MSRRWLPLLLSWFVLPAWVAAGAAESPPIIFTGDVLLGREVIREVRLKGRVSPWEDLVPLFRGAQWVMGNLEGAVGDVRRCAGRPSPCFAVDPQDLALLKGAGFRAMGIENNHSADLGDEGRAATAAELERLSIAAVRWEDSPGFVRFGQYTLGVVALSAIPGKDGTKVEIPSPAVRQKVALARALADWVVVSVHWGAELADWPSNAQRAQAEWLIAQGADLIVGHHPHVVQQPECIAGRPVFFSLGNHVFDQKYPATKQGLLAICRIEQGTLRCAGRRTATPVNSSFPSLGPEGGTASALGCVVPAAAPTSVNGTTIRVRLPEGQYRGGKLLLEGMAAPATRWVLPAHQILALEPALLAPPPAAPLLFTVERHLSPIDGESAPRPYVYQLTARGPAARWRGSALAWPLIDATLLPGPDGVDLLCALHRADSFVVQDRAVTGTRTAVYRWNGFGFSGADDPPANEACRRTFAAHTTPKLVPGPNGAARH